MRKKIRRFPNYEVSDRGEVYTIKPAEKLTPYIGKSGYPGVWVKQKNKRPKYKLLHRLVADAFLSPKPAKGYLIRHLDGNPLNNAVSNLKWGTAKENAEDRLRHASSYAKLTLELVMEIKKKLETEEREAVAKSCNVSFLTVNKIYYDEKAI